MEYNGFSYKFISINKDLKIEMSQGLTKPKKLKLTDYEIFQTLGTGSVEKSEYIKVKVHLGVLSWHGINKQISMWR